MIRANLHNVIFIVVIAALGFWILKAAGRTQLANTPVVGQVLQLFGQAA